MIMINQLTGFKILFPGKMNMNRILGYHWAGSSCSMEALGFLLRIQSVFKSLPFYDS